MSSTAHSSPKDEKGKTKAPNYLPPTYQENFMESVRQKLINIDFGPRKPKQYPLPASEEISLELLTTNALKKTKLSNVFTFHLVNAVANHIDRVIMPKYQQKYINGKPPQDSAMFKEYLQDMEDLFEAGRQIMLAWKKRLNEESAHVIQAYINDFNKLASQCKEEREFIDKKLFPNVYMLIIPKDDYKRIKKKSSVFHPEGGATVAAKTVTGAVGVGVSFLGSLAVTFLAAKGGNSLTNGAMLAATTGSSGRDGVLDNSLDWASTAADYGRWVREDMPAKWVAGTLGFVRKGRPYVAPTAEFKDHKVDSRQEEKIYVVDARSPQDFLKHGTNYHLSLDEKRNPGKVIFFTNPEHALAFAREHANADKFDPIGGWRLHKNWTDAERQNVYNAVPQAIPELLTSMVNPPPAPQAAITAATAAPPQSSAAQTMTQLSAAAASSPPALQTTSNSQPQPSAPPLENKSSNTAAANASASAAERNAPPPASTTSTHVNDSTIEDKKEHKMRARK